jgi:hypothetical protein
MIRKAELASVIRSIGYLERDKIECIRIGVYLINRLHSDTYIWGPEHSAHFL